MHARVLATVTLVGVLVAGCTASSDPLRESSRARRTPYAGALFLSAPAGAAGAVVQCSATPIGGSSTTPYSEGSVGRSAAGALDDADTVVALNIELLHVERREATRVLYTTVYDGVARQALVVHYGPATPGTGADSHGKGWYPESWAACDWSDFPERVSAAKHVEVWHDAHGRRVDTRTITSSGRGCLGDASVTVGRRLFERAPLSELSGYFTEHHLGDQPLPADAVDTGWSRGRRHLWLSRTRPRAYVGSSAAHVEFWPELTTAIGCD